jgi:hypothetical protein
MLLSMRSLCPLACLMACTFTGPGERDAGGIDAVIEYGVVEEMMVPSRGEMQVSSFVLEQGVPYRLRASGTYFFALQVLGDAEYFGFNNGPPLDASVNIDVGLAVNDATVDINRTPRWGTYSEAHVYETPWPGAGAPITAQLHDGQYNDNDGELKLEILAPR